MSAAAGAPPPPPPPPSKTSFDSLPAELLLEIVQHLQINDFIKLTLAIYSILQHHGIVPPLTDEIYHRITSAQLSALKTGIAGKKGMGARDAEQPNERNGPVPLPIELNDQIMDYLEPADRIAWLFSDRGMFAVYFPELSAETRRQLREALRHARDAFDKGKK